MVHKRKLGLKVPPLSTATIAAEAKICRDSFRLTKPEVDICRLIEALDMVGVLNLEIVEDDELKGEEARTYPNKNRIVLTNSVYDGALSGDGRARFTIAHELGHLNMHKGIEPAFSRGDHQVYEDSEWQADTFASEFLMDSRFISSFDTAEDLVKKFGVSYTAACMRLKKIKR